MYISSLQYSASVHDRMTTMRSDRPGGGRNKWLFDTGTTTTEGTALDLLQRRATSRSSSSRSGKMFPILIGIIIATAVVSLLLFTTSSSTTSHHYLNLPAVSFFSQSSSSLHSEPRAIGDNSKVSRTNFRKGELSSPFAPNVNKQVAIEKDPSTEYEKLTDSASKESLISISEGLKAYKRNENLKTDVGTHNIINDNKNGHNIINVGNKNDNNLIKSSTASAVSNENLHRADDLLSLYKVESSKRSKLTLKKLSSHPIFQFSHENEPLENVMVHLSQSEACLNKPIFTSMASVSSDIYWQLIENFVYSMLKFNLIECSILICVSDEECMNKCRQNSFPCFQYDYFYFHQEKIHSVEPVSPMEQIATLKLFELPKALAKGVSVFMVDLDVGFLEDPMLLTKDFMKPGNKVDIYVQKDISFVMDRSEKGWRTWFTVPLPNIGMFLCRGNMKTSLMFEKAWKDYLTIDKPIKMNPGKDQNKVVNAMQDSGFRWRYFDTNQTVLLDKVFKFVKEEYELGGVAADRTLRDWGAIAAHTTCYDSATKVMGLKASNAFWSPFYYDYNRRTLTKKLLFVTESELLEEVRTLLYLALVTKRALIIPNILGYSSLGNIQFQDKVLWPGFRVLHSDDDLIMNTIIEPQFYWRMAKDYSSPVGSHDSTDKIPIPAPFVVNFDASHSQVGDIEYLLNSDTAKDAIRVVLNSEKPDRLLKESNLISWADESLEGYLSYGDEAKDYLLLPKIDHRWGGKSGQMKIDKKIARRIVVNSRLCQRVFKPNQGNRSCFDKCR